MHKHQFKSAIYLLAVLLLAGATALLPGQDRAPRAGANSSSARPNAEGEAAPDHPFVRRFFQRFDLNGDDAVDWSEFDGAEERFRNWDQNHDGKIDRRELSAQLPARPQWQAPPAPDAHQLGPDEQARLFIQRFDQDGSGQVSRREFPGNNNRFEHLDGNGDGQITLEEYEFAARRSHPRHPPDGAPPQPRAGPGRGPRMIEAFDLDQNQRLSKDEFLRGGERLFDLLDENRNGELEPHELDFNPAPPAEPAQPDPRRPARRMLERLDINNNGRIERSEWRGAAERFNTIDRNANGYLELQELIDSRANERNPERRLRGFMQRHDKDGDGAVTPEEFEGAPARFDQLDRDGDGEVRAEEVRELQDRRARQPPPGGPREVPPPEHPPRQLPDDN